MCGGYCSLREFEAPVICGTAAAKNEAAVEAQEALNLITARPPCSRAPLRYGGELGYVWGWPTGQAAGEEPYEILRAYISWGSGVWRSVKHGVLLQAFLSRDVVCNEADRHKLPQLLPVRPLILLPLQHAGAAWRARRTHRWAVKYDFLNVTTACIRAARANTTPSSSLPVENWRVSKLVHCLSMVNPLTFPH